MPNKSKVETHSKKDLIDKALIRGDSYRDIAGRFGLTKTAIGRYMKDKLVPKVAKAQAARELKAGTDLLNRLESYISVTEKVLNAAEEYLQDPVDPEKLFIGPRATEIKVSYIQDDGNNPGLKRTATLQELLSRVQEKDILVDNFEMDFEDPRQTILNAANALSKQLELYRKIRGDIHNVSLDLTIQPAFRLLVNAILHATKENPEIRREIAKALKSLGIDEGLSKPI